jgi:hypothetical protein
VRTELGLHAVCVSRMPWRHAIGSSEEVRAEQINGAWLALRRVCEAQALMRWSEWSREGRERAVQTLGP